MKGLENPDYLLMYIASNIIGLIFLWVAWRKPKIARFMFALLYGWACWINYTLAHTNPEAYLGYATMATGFYSEFINGWFSQHVKVMVTIIAVGQGMIAIGMLLKNIWVKLACAGVVLFLLAIAPLGVGAAFPFSITVSLAAVMILLKDDLDYIWRFNKPTLPGKLQPQG